MEQPPRNLNAYRVAELREMATKLGLPTGGTKAELIDRIRAHYRAPTPTPATTVPQVTQGAPQVTQGAPQVTQGAPQVTQGAPQVTVPERRRQNPFETINDIAGTLGDVLNGRRRFEDVRDQVRRELGTYTIVDFKNVYEVIGITRPRQPTKANYIDKLMTYLETYTPPRVAPTIPIGIPTVPKEINDFLLNVIKTPRLIDDRTIQRQIRDRFNQLSREQAVRFMKDQLDITVDPIFSQEYTANLFMNTIKDYNGTTGGLDITLASPGDILRPDIGQDAIDLIYRDFDVLSLPLGIRYLQDKVGLTAPPGATKRQLADMFIAELRKRAGPPATPLATIDPELLRYFERFILEPKFIYTPNEEMVLKRRLEQLLSETQLKALADERFEIPIPRYYTKDFLVNAIVENIKHRYEIEFVYDYISEFIREPQKLTTRYDEDNFRRTVQPLNEQQLRNILRDSLNILAPVDARKDQLIDLLIRTIRDRARTPARPITPLAPNPIPAYIRDYIDKFMTDPQLILDPASHRLLREYLNTLSTEQLRNFLREKFNVFTGLDALKIQLVDTFILKLQERAVPTATPIGQPTELLDRVIANPQLINTPHMTEDIYDVLNEMSNGEIGVYFNVKLIPIEINPRTNKREITNKFISYVRGRAQATTALAGAQMQPIRGVPTVPPIPTEIRYNLDNMIQNPRLVNNPLNLNILEERLKTLSPEQLGLLLEDKFRITPPRGATKEQLVSTILDTLRLQAPTVAPIPPGIREYIDMFIADPRRLERQKERDDFYASLDGGTSEHLRAILQEYFNVTPPPNVNKDQLIASIVENIRRRAPAPTIAPLPPFPKVAPPTARPAPTPARDQLLNSIRQKVQTNPLSNSTQRNLRTGYNTEISAINVADMITNGYYLDKDAPLSYFRRTYPTEIIMSQGDRFATQVLDQLRYRNFDAMTTNETALDDKLSFIRLLEIYRDNNVLTTEETALVMTLSTPEIITLLGPTYTGPKDRASILWALIKRRNPPPVSATEDPRYAMILQRDPRIIMRLAADVHDYFGSAEQAPSEYSPYRHLLVYPESILDSFVTDYQREFTAGFAQSLGMIIPVGVDDEEYYFRNLRKYIYIFSRPENTPPPPQLDPQARRATNKQKIRIYTDYELVDAYEIYPPYDWDSRSDLIKRILDETETYARGSQWSFHKRSCNNDDTINIVSGDLRDKDDPNNPILSYGTMNNYRCYNLEELVASFRPTETGFVFAVPDWKAGQEMSLFPLPSIRQLRTLLLNMGDAPLFQPLIDKITEGFAQMNQAGARLRGLRAQYVAFPPNQQELVRDYLSWMFFLSATFRFWKGPPNPYPMVWVEGGGRDQLCTEIQRDENAVYWMALRTRILSAMPKTLEEWLLGLPRVKYNFQTGDATLGEEVIDFVITKAQEGNFCLADASDRIIQTSYYLATRILSLDNNQFNRLMKEEIVRLFTQYEIPALTSLLDGAITQLQGRVTPDTLKLLIKNVNRVRSKLDLVPPVSDREPQQSLLRIAQEMKQNLPRLQQTATESMRIKAGQQPDFVPGDVTKTHHTDPFIRLTDVATD